MLSPQTKSYKREFTDYNLEENTMKRSTDYSKNTTGTSVEFIDQAPNVSL